MNTLRALSPFSVLLLAALAGCGSSTSEEPTFEARPSAEVLAQAAENSKHTILWFHADGDSNVAATARILKQAEEKWSDRAEVVSVKVDDAAHRDLVQKYNVRRTPLVLVVAPNGAVTAGFASLADLGQLAQAFVSPAMAEILQAVQQDQAVFLCVGSPQDPRAARNLAEAKEAERMLEGIARVVALDPQDQAEGDLLRTCKVDRSDSEAELVTVVVSPRGSLVARLTGDITTERLFDSFAKILQIPRGCGSAGVTGGSTCQPGKGVAGKAGCN